MQQDQLNPITSSLRAFASSAFDRELEEPDLSIDDIMKEFASNGYIVDENINTTEQKKTSQSTINISKTDENNNVLTQQKTIYSQSTKFTRYDENNNIFPQQKTIYHKNDKTWKRIIQQKDKQKPQPEHCVFCQNNNEPKDVVQSHSVRDSFGRILCPKLRIYICPICGASGDEAHTLKYCPQKRIYTLEDTILAEALRLARMKYSWGKKRFNAATYLKETIM